MTVSNTRKALAGWTRKSLHSVLHVKNMCLQVPAYSACSLSQYISVLMSLYLLPCLPLYSSSQRQIWAVFHNPVAKNSMSSGYAQPNDAMHSCPTSHMEKKGLSQIVTLETRMMQTTTQRKPYAESKLEFIECELFYIFYVVTK